MGTLPVPRYTMGQTVYAVEIADSEERVSCRDCNGTRKWDCTKPSGETTTIRCPTCMYGYESRGWEVNQLGLKGSVRELTIGSIRINTEDTRLGPVSYMCKETGVGSGTIWSEPKLYDSRADADAAIEQQLAVKLQEKEDAELRHIAHSIVDAGSGVAYWSKLVRQSREGLKRNERALAQAKGES